MSVKRSASAWTEAQPRLLVGLIGIEHRKIGGIAVLVLQPGKVEAGLRRFGRGGGRLQRLGILLDRDQRVGDILERGEDGASILLGRLRVGRAGRALLVELGPAVENRREQRGADVPEAGAGTEDLADRERVGARISAERDVRQAVGPSDPDVGACRVEIGFGLKHVGALLDQRRREAERKVGRKREARQRELFAPAPAPG